MITRNFSREEFACQGENCCGHSAPVHPHLAHCLQALRNIISDDLDQDVPLTISSGFRCVTHNKEIGGAEHSKHCEGTAVDVMCPDILSVDEFYKYALQIHGFKMGGIGIYHSRLHLDVRGELARWDER